MQSRSIAGDISQRNGLTETATSSSNLDGSRNTRHVWKYAWKLNIASPDTKKVYCGDYICLFFFLQRILWYLKRGPTDSSQYTVDS